MTEETERIIWEAKTLTGVLDELNAPTESNEEGVLYSLWGRVSKLLDARESTIAAQAETIERLKEALKNLTRTPLGYASYQEATALLAELETK